MFVLVVDEAFESRSLEQGKSLAGHTCLGVIT